MYYSRFVLALSILVVSAQAAPITTRADPDPNQGQPISVGVSQPYVGVYERLTDRSTNKALHRGPSWLDLLVR